MEDGVAGRKVLPVLAGDRVLPTASEGDDLTTICLSGTTGKVQWRRSIRVARLEAQRSLNHCAVPTAATGGKSVFVFFTDFGLITYDFEGKQQWQLPLGPFNSPHGVAASPVYADGRVVLVCDQDTGDLKSRCPAYRRPSFTRTSFPSSEAAESRPL